MMSHIQHTFWQSIWVHFKRRRLGLAALFVVAAYCLVGIYAPFLASSKPFVVQYEGEWYFPLFRYLFYTGFYTKGLDVFFNLLIFTFPLFCLAFYFLKGKVRTTVLLALLIFQCLTFLYLMMAQPKDPIYDAALTQERLKTLGRPVSWEEELKTLSPYARLNLLLHEQRTFAQHKRLVPFKEAYEKVHNHSIPTVWQMRQDHEQRDISNLQAALQKDPNDKGAQSDLNYLMERRRWLDEGVKELHHEWMPLLRDYHWEDDAGGEQSLNQFVPWWELTRINRKDLMAALIFGVRVSLVVGIMAVALALVIGIPIGAFAGYYGGTSDIVVSRLLEIWESMPTFFMLLLVVAVTQSKSIFIVIAVIGFFGWTSFSRYIRGEFFKQRNLSYVEACRSLGLNDSTIMFSHVLPNAIPPLLTLLPFAVMAAITSEAGLSFLGLGEENSPSWGVLMDEGRSAFPGESYLLWPPAILLTALLIAIALVGDALRDALDPKTH